MHRELSQPLVLAHQSVDVLGGDNPEHVIREFGMMLHDGWVTKHKLASSVSSKAIDDLYERA